MRQRAWNRTGTILVAACVAVLASPAGAAETDDLSQLKKQLAELNRRIEQLEARQKTKEKSTEKLLAAVGEKADAAAETAETNAGLLENLKWAEKIEFSGDFRYRYDYLKMTPERHRNRIRARLNMAAEVTDEWDAVMRIASGDKDTATSTNQDLTDGFSHWDLWLDRAYLDYHPRWADGLSVTAGKIPNPFYTVGKNQMIWDGDVNPEGGALSYSRALNDHTSVTVSGGGFWVEEEGGGPDAGLFGVQAYAKHTINAPTYVLAGAGWYDYSNIDVLSGDPTFSLKGNRAGPGGYLSDFDLVEVFAEAGTEVAGMPVTVFGDYVYNTAAANAENTGWIGGVIINKAKAPGSWQFSYSYRDMQADALLGRFNFSDFIDGGTNVKGHCFGLGYQWAKNVQTAVTWVTGEYGDAGTDGDRLLADVQLKF